MTIVHGPLEKSSRIKTKYVKNKIKELNFSNKQDKEYIKDLMFLEEFVENGGPSSLAGGYAFHSLTHSYPEEYLEIKKELKGLKINVKKALEKKKQAEKRAEQRERAEERKEEQQDKKNWIRLGGKP